MKKGKEKFLFVLCILLAILADSCLLVGKIGISYSAFVAAFYFVFFYRYWKTPFTHKLINGLLFISVWILTISYVVYSNPILNGLNFILIPLLVYTNTVLLTSSPSVKWHSKTVPLLLRKKLAQMMMFGRLLLTLAGRKVKRHVDESTYDVGKKIAIGILLSIPMLFVIIALLSAADEQFAKILMLIPQRLLNFQMDFIWRIARISIIFIVLYFFLKVAGKQTLIMEKVKKDKKRNWDSIVMTTILLLMNLIYLLFTIVQFRYFFNSELTNGFSYSEYARRGFFELIFVSIINFVLLISTVTMARRTAFLKTLLTMLIMFSYVMLVSAFLRLMMYEEAYGFTYLRVLAHSFMIFLAFMFLFTLVKVWIERLSLARFYIIGSLLYYVGLNVIGIDQMIVTKNIQRYEQTGKIDVNYLKALSSSAIPELVQLSNSKQEILGLRNMLIEKKAELKLENQTWQSYNIPDEEAKAALEKMK